MSVQTKKRKRNVQIQHGAEHLISQSFELALNYFEQLLQFRGSRRGGGEGRGSGYLDRRDVILTLPQSIKNTYPNAQEEWGVNLWKTICIKSKMICIKSKTICIICNRSRDLSKPLSCCFQLRICICNFVKQAINDVY